MMTPSETTSLFWSLIGFGGFLVWHELTLRRENANMPVAFALFLAWMIFILLMATGAI